ncbi:preprotein translocase subunit SecE [Tsukamurella sp. 8F]|uniref:preprotein translocase subunit SecE n=1 Tax=unclassified Tsukamurella TaxID=2633480 RepID=UPI0023B9B324|nr:MULTISPECIES: preprotein translocase subunit SecE [unclassified Tsukamurella]MDF0531621.1 preprotein translocase subunit SecE [Tsukamurella sp. 8J]MDF0588811.1 preprotein translocase subunit SecE [Tsukamurella sp. 8F]
MSDERDDVTEDAKSAADDADAAARPSGKRGSRRGRALLDESGAGESTSRGGTATLTKPKAAKATATQSRNPFAAVWLFLRQVVAELRKVIWPNRRQTATYVMVVLVFVVVLTAFISGLDIGFAKLVLWAFG